MTSKKRLTDTNKHKRVHLIGNAHLDPVWLWRWQEGFAEVMATFQSALDRMNENDDYLFTCSSAAFYEWVEENDPDMFLEIVRRVEEGRWVITGGWWVQSDCNLPNGEALVRQGLYAQRYFKKKFGITSRVGYCVDSFGHAATLPKILSGCGMKGYMFMRPGSHENAEIPQLAFRWKADDGTSVTALRIPKLYNSLDRGVIEEKIHHNLELAAETPLKNEVFVMYGIGNHGGGPTKAMLAAIREWQNDVNMPTLIHSSPEDFITVAENCNLPCWEGELQHHASGCYSVVSEIKTENRRVEHALQSAELWCSAAYGLVGKQYPLDDLTHAWKLLLFNQFHDILPGSATAEACSDAIDQLGAAKYNSQVAKNSAQQAISRQIDTSGSNVPIVVFNNQPFPFEGVWESDDVGFALKESARKGITLTCDGGKQVPCQSIEPHSVCDRTRLAARISIPSLGYTLLRLKWAEKAEKGKKGENQPKLDLPTGHPHNPVSGIQTVTAEQLSMENAELRASINQMGDLVLFDKRTQRKVFEDAGGIPLIIEDTSDTWSHDVTKFDTIIGRFKRIDAKIIESGPVRAGISVQYIYGKSSLTLDYYLGAGDSFVRIKGSVNWQEKWKMLKLAFPVPFWSDSWTAEIPYGTIERPTNGNEEPVLQWVDISAPNQGVAIANDCKYSCSAEPGEIRYTLVRSPAYAADYHSKGYDYSRHKFTDQGYQTFSFAVMPHNGNWRDSRVIEAAGQLNNPPDMVIQTLHKGTLPASMGFIAVSRKGVYIQAVKESENRKGFIVRAAEWFGERAKVSFDTPSLGRKWTAQFGKHEIKTFFIPNNGLEPVEEVSMLEPENEEL